MAGRVWLVEDIQVNAVYLEARSYNCDVSSARCAKRRPKGGFKFRIHI